MDASGEARPGDDTVKILAKKAAKTPQGRYRWRTVEDNKVRAAHAQHNRMIRAWTDSPDPCEDYNCRCWAEKVSDEEIEKGVLPPLELEEEKIPGTNIPDHGIPEQGWPGLDKYDPYEPPQNSNPDDDFSKFPPAYPRMNEIDDLPWPIKEKRCIVKGNVMNFNRCNVFLTGILCVIFCNPVLAKDYKVRIRGLIPETESKTAICNENELCFLTLDFPAANDKNKTAYIDIGMNFVEDMVSFQFMHNREYLSVTSIGKNVLTEPVSKFLETQPIKLFAPQRIEHSTSLALSRPIVRISPPVAEVEISVKSEF